MTDMRGETHRRKQVLRFVIYFSGLVILAVGITLNTKTTLGVSPIISVAYSVSQIWNLNFANVTFIWYGVFVLIQMVLHLLRKPPDLKRKLASDGMQFAVSLISTRFMDLFGAAIPVFQTDCPDSFAGSFAGRFLFLLLAIALTGIGASMSLFTRIVPNPGDGLVQGISDFTGISAGTTKNLVDLTCVLLTLTLSLLLAHRVIGVGIGTLAAIAGVGRVVAVFERLFGAQIRKLTEPSGVR